MEVMISASTEVLIILVEVDGSWTSMEVTYIFPVKEGTSTEAPWKQTCSFHGSILEQLP